MLVSRNAKRTNAPTGVGATVLLVTHVSNAMGRGVVTSDQGLEHVVETDVGPGGCDRLSCRQVNHMFEYGDVVG